MRRFTIAVALTVLLLACPVAAFALGCETFGRIPPCFDVYVRALSTSSTLGGKDVEIWNREDPDEDGYTYRVQIVNWANNPDHDCVANGPCDTESGPRTTTKDVVPVGTSGSPEILRVGTMASQLHTGLTCGYTGTCPGTLAPCNSTTHACEWPSQCAQTTCGNSICDMPCTTDGKGVCVNTWFSYVAITHYKEPYGGQWVALNPAKELCRRTDTGGQCWTVQAAGCRNCSSSACSNGAGTGPWCRDGLSQCAAIPWPPAE